MSFADLQPWHLILGFFFVAAVFMGIVLFIATRKNADGSPKFGGKPGHLPDQPGSRIPHNDIPTFGGGAGDGGGGGH